MTWKAINDTKRHQKSNTMTTIANVRALLEEIVELFDSAISARYPHEILRDIRAALATPATAPEQCWCDEHDIGEPGVPCGDCPMQDYKPPATAPAQPERKPMMDQTAHDMNLVAEKYAHKLARDLECVLADYSGTWYDTAMKTLCEYRSAMNAIHERECPTFNSSWHYERLDRLLSMTLSDESYADYLYSLNIVAAAPSQPAVVVERKPMADDDTLDLFNRVQRGMRFTDRDLQPFSAGVAAAEYFHGIKDKP